MFIGNVLIGNVCTRGNVYSGELTIVVSSTCRVLQKISTKDESCADKGLVVADDEKAAIGVSEMIRKMEIQRLNDTQDSRDEDGEERNETGRWLDCVLGDETIQFATSAVIVSPYYHRSWRLFV